MGFLYRAIKNSRQPKRGAQARRNISLAPIAFAVGELRCTKDKLGSNDPPSRRAGRGSEILTTKLHYPGSGFEPGVGEKASLRGEHTGYCAFNFVRRDAFHVASIRWWTRVRTFKLQRYIACRF